MLAACANQIRVVTHACSNHYAMILFAMCVARAVSWRRGARGLRLPRGAAGSCGDDGVYIHATQHLAPPTYAQTSKQRFQFRDVRNGMAAAPAFGEPPRIRAGGSRLSCVTVGSTFVGACTKVECGGCSAATRSHCFERGVCRVAANVNAQIAYSGREAPALPAEDPEVPTSGDGNEPPTLQTGLPYELEVEQDDAGGAAAPRPRSSTRYDPEQDVTDDETFGVEQDGSNMPIQPVVFHVQRDGGDAAKGNTGKKGKRGKGQMKRRSKHMISLGPAHTGGMLKNPMAVQTATETSL